MGSRAAVSYEDIAVQQIMITMIMAMRSVRRFMGKKVLLAMRCARAEKQEGNRAHCSKEAALRNGSFRILGHGPRQPLPEAVP